MENFMDIFNDDAFSLVSMVAAINNIDNIPGRAGELCFAGVGEGISTTTVTIESRDQELALVPTSPRGSPSPQEKQDKGKLFPIQIPQIKLEETIGAHQIQGVREFGSTNVLRGVQSVMNRQMQKIVNKLDLTLEHHRLGALRGIIRDADGSKLLNLYDTFGVQEAPDFNFNLDNFSASDAFDDTVRVNCQKVSRFMRRNAKMTLPTSAKIWAFCGDNFFDKLIEHPSVKNVFQNWQAAEQRLGANYAEGIFYFGGIFFENYAGTDDGGDNPSTGGTVGIPTDEARFFITGVPGLYAEYFAPADFFDTVNTIGLPRYSRLAVDTELQRWVKMHVQQNPLPLCLRPRTLVRGVSAPGDVGAQSAD